MYYRLFIFFVGVYLLPFTSSGQVVFNEMMANNQNTVFDTDGDPSDWIELYNNSGAAVNLSGFSLSDNIDSLRKWIFPSYTLNAGSFLRVWCSDKNRLTAPFHTNFSIDASGEAVYLSDASGAVIDVFGPVYMPMDYSYGRYPNGSNNLLYLSVATPATSNNFASTFVGAIQEKPTFSIKGGYFTGPVTVSISHIDPTVTIRYTTDGSEPTANSALYTGPITVNSRASDPNYYSLIRTCYQVHFWLPEWNPPLGNVFKSTPVRARAFKTGYLPSPVKTETYFVDPSMFSRYPTLPVVSIVSDPKNLFNDTTGIYVPGINYVPGTFQANYYNNWSRPANIEYFLPDGTQQVNSNFKISINGVSSQSSPQKGLNVTASGDYGASKFRFPVFQNTPGIAKYITEFDKLKIRAWGSDRAKALFRDAYTASFMHYSGVDYEAYQPCVVFIDGEYWGLQEIRERNRNSDYYEEHYLIGADNPGYDIVDLQTMQPVEGTATSWNTLQSFILSNNMADTANFNQVSSSIDLRSFLMHYLFSIYFSRGDWPDQNEAVVRPRDNSMKWKWMIWDMDNTTAYYLNPWYDMFNQAMIGSRGYGPSDLLNAFLANTQFKYDFINIFCDWMNTAFLPTLMQQRVDSMKATLSPYMTEFQNRWQTNSNWTAQTDSMKWWVGLRSQFCRSQLQSAFSLPVSNRLGLQVSDTLKGNIQINTIRLDRHTPRTSNYTFPWAGYYYAGVPVPLTAIAKPGFKFLHWLPSMDTSRSIILNMNSDTLLTAVFDIDPNYRPPLPLVINEVQTSNLANVADNYGEYDDWIEIYNPNADTVDVAGWYLSDNLVLPTRFRFASGSDSTKIPPYGYLLVWADDDREQGQLHTNFKFNASGDLIMLYRPDGETLADSISFPNIGTDLSFGRRYDASQDWVTFTNSTPNATNMEVTAAPIFINELMPSNTSFLVDENQQYDDWIELYNPSADTVDFSGCFISDDPANPKKHRFPMGSDSLKIPPYGFRLLWADGQPGQGVLHLPFTLSSTGESVYLFRQNGDSLIDSVVFGPVATDDSYGRSYDGSPSWIVFTTPTPRHTNQEIPSGQLIINELLTVNVNSVTDDFGEHDPWVELFNPGNDTIDLAGWFMTEDVGHPDRFRFPHGSTNTRVAPGEHKLVWSDSRPDQGALHLNFTLPISNGCVELLKPDQLSYGDVYCYTAPLADQSVGRSHDGGPLWIDFTVPTPAAVNWLYTNEAVLINELQADNRTTISDAAGQFDPWIELYNPNSDTLNLEGWYITDDPSTPNKYRFGYDNDSLKIPPQGFRLLWADNELSQGVLHVGFRLSINPSCVVVSRPDISFSDSVCYPLTMADHSWGRMFDGTTPWMEFSIPTPDSNNVDLSTAVIQPIGNSSLNVYPNPSRGMPVRLNIASDFEVIDDQGKVVGAFRNTSLIPVEGWHAGLYLLRTTRGEILRFVIL